jgi:hypothetical protein
MIYLVHEYAEEWSGAAQDAAERFGLRKATL